MRSRITPLLLLVLLATNAHAQRDLYADASATGVADGSSWANAFPSLQQAANALLPGDTLMTRGTFYETATIGTEGVTVLGDTDPDRPTWIRGDRYSALKNWIPAGQTGSYIHENISQLIGTTLKPGSVIYNYKRDDLVGSVTGIDLRRFYSELPVSGAGVYYGHLKKGTGATNVYGTPGSWWWDFANDRLYVRIPDGETFDHTKLGVCINDKNALSVTANNVRVSGVNTLCTPGFVNNRGYGIKGTGSISVTFENADIIDSGWHAAGVETESPYNCTLRNIRAWSSGVDIANSNNPFVFFSATNRPDAGHLGEDLTFHAYPLLGVDGKPVASAFRPLVGLSHTSGLTAHRLGGITWRRLHLVDQLAQVEAKHNIQLTTSGAAVVANDTPPFNSLDHDLYPIVVEDSIFEGPGAVPSASIRYERCVFVPGSSRVDGEYRITTTGPILLRACTLEIGQAGQAQAAAFFNLSNVARLYMDLCTIHAEHDNPMRNLVRTTYGGIYARQSVFSAKNPTALMLIWQDGWEIFHSRQSFQQCYFAGPMTTAAHPWLAPKTQSWWLENIDADAIFGPTGVFVDPTGSNLRPVFGSALDTSRSANPLPDIIALTDIDGRPYNQRYGAAQSRCRGDTNHDGVVSPADFTAWIAAYNAGHPDADINADSLLTPADFTAWIAAYNAGC